MSSANPHHVYTEPYIRCNQCDAINIKVKRPYSYSVNCHRCNHRLYFFFNKWYQHCSAYVIAATLCFIMSYMLPFMVLNVGTMEVEARVLTGMMKMIAQGEWVLVALLFFTIFIFAIFEIFTLSFILISLRVKYRGIWIKRMIKIISYIRPWNMLEIFLVSTVVTSIKLVDLATVSPGIGLITFFLLIVLLILAHQKIDYVWIWDWINKRNSYKHFHTERKGVPKIACHHCHAFIDENLFDDIKYCPRCNTKLHHRIVNSKQRTMALLLVAILFYIPANTLPIMYSTTLGDQSANTILSGALYLFESGAWFVGLVIIFASVVVPLAKMAIMSYLLWSLRRKARLTAKIQAKLYRIIEAVGRWSMIDVFVVISLVAMVQFGIIANIDVGPAILPFATVVILTMLAAKTFDPRLIWDNPNVEQ